MLVLGQYVNDMSGCVTAGELHLYADNTKAFVIGNNTEEVIDLLNISAGDIYTIGATKTT